MAFTTGARTQVAFSPETAFRTLPTSGWRTLLVSGITLTHGHEANADEVVQGHDARMPVRGPTTAELALRMPLDTAAIGIPLRALLGAPTTTGTGPYTHTFDPVAPSSPIRTYSIEQFDPDGPVSRRVRGAAATRLQFTVSARGISHAAMDWIAAAVDINTATAASGATALTGTVLSNTLANLTLDGSSAGPVLSADISVEAPREFDYYVDGNAEPDAVVLADRYRASARLRARITDTSLLNRLTNGTETNLQIVWQVSANESLTVRLPRARCDRASGRTEGPGGLELDLEFVSAAGASLPSVRFILVNGVASY